LTTAAPAFELVFPAALPLIQRKAMIGVIPYTACKLRCKGNQMALFPLFLLTCAVAGAAGVLFRPGQWYQDLDKPGWTPPNWLFPVVWSALYVLMALAATRIAAIPGTALALGLWGLQIALNTLWSGVFFGLHRILAGAVIIALLWVVVLAATLVFWGHDLIAALMMVPYLIWGTFALALNISVWLRNPTQYHAARV